MTTNGNQTMQKFVFIKRVVMSDKLVFDAERELALPIQPFVGMHLYNTEWRPPDCDESDDEIEEIAYDVNTGRVFCYLPVDDFRPESGDDEWTEEEVLEHYRDWTIKRERFDEPPNGWSERNGAQAE